MLLSSPAARSQVAQWGSAERLRADHVIPAHPGWLTFVDRHQAARVLKKPCPIWELQAAVEQEPAESEAAE